MKKETTMENENKAFIEKANEQTDARSDWDGFDEEIEQMEWAIWDYNDEHAKG